METKFKLIAEIFRYKEDGGGLFYTLRKGDIHDIKLKEITFCCETMKNVWDEFIGFGEEDSILNRESTVNIYNCHPWPEGAVWDSKPISYCPFCATKIEIELIESK